jgi:hypothetical protein
MIRTETPCALGTALSVETTATLMVRILRLQLNTRLSIATECA